jgi:glycosyltransferase involved in cell wall biosynthesis
MNILYYIPRLNQSGGGTRQYAIALLNILAKDDSGNQYYILHNTEDPLVIELVQRSQNLFLIPKSTGEKKIEKLGRHFSKMSNDVFAKAKWRVRLPSINYLNRICRKFKIDIIHCPYQFTPEANGVKKICTMHDVQELHFPEYFTPVERKDRAVGYLNSLFNADLIFVSYNHIKKDIVKYFQIPEEKIRVCLLDMDNLWFKKYIDRRIQGKEVNGLPEKFLFYPANTWKHKNHIGLLNAVAFLRNERSEKVHLICTGDKNQHFSSSIEPKLKELGLEDQVRFLGVVDEEELFNLYHKCTGVVIPTIYEAGSFPLMESMLMEIPVICSNVTSLPETIGNPQFVFDAFDTKDMAEKILELYNNPDYRKQSIDNSRSMSPAIVNTHALEKVQAAYISLFEKEKLV